ncbi:MAG: alpha/beta fold hydrolase [Deltaproteobacteria bacterium]|nr:MAG: alpha/beta fold hydrolase [Deltaproteobacteria bacterium]
MSNVEANGITIEYDNFGERSARPLLLIMGLGAQMVLWDEELCRMLADRGHYVVRFDNRDVGLSSKIDGVGDIVEAFREPMRGEKIETPYTLDDMADDAVGLLDALGIEEAHICGASMGGMIAQTIAIRHPSRVRSLISIMSAAGNFGISPADLGALQSLVKPLPEKREDYIEYAVDACRVFAGKGFRFDEQGVREIMARSYDRCFYPQGTVRQLMAVLSHGSRKEALASVKTPTLVIHGSDDPLVPVEWGKDTAKAVPGAELLIIEGMGHEMPVEVWPRLVEAISEHTEKAG